MSAGNPRVSLCMIVRDEERNLRECLTPVAALFDEIVIVDTGSRDSTRAIAAEFTTHVHEFSWCDDFSAARNESLRHATGDWIFWLDADDRIRPEQVARLRQLIQEGLDERPRAFFMDTVMAPTEPNEEVSLVTHIRLFRRSDALHWEGRVHEQLHPELRTIGFDTAFSNVQIEHVGYQNAVVRERKARRKLRLLRMDYAVDPNNPSTLLHLGLMLFRTNNREAKGHLLRILKMRLGDLSYLRRAYSMLATLSQTEGNPTEAIRFTQQGLELYPDDEHLLFAQASARYALEEFAAAVQILRRIIEAPGSQKMSYGDVANIRTKLAPRMLGAVERMLKMYPEAEATLQAVIHDFPADNSTWYNLGLVYLDQGHGYKLAPIIRRLLELRGGNIDAGLLAALWHMRHGHASLAAPIIDDLIAQAPQMPRPRMLRAECLSRCHAPLEAQIRALQDVVRVHPGNTEARHWLRKAQLLQSASVQPAVSVETTSVVLMPGMPVG